MSKLSWNRNPIGIIQYVSMAGDAATVRNHAHALAQRIDAQLGDEQVFFIDGCELDWEQLPRPDMPLAVGIDGSYVHSNNQSSRKKGRFWECGVVFSAWIRGVISFAGSGRNIGRDRNPLLLKGVVDASGNRAIKIIQRAYL